MDAIGNDSLLAARHQLSALGVAEPEFNAQCCNEFNLGFCRENVSDRLEQAAVIEAVTPLKRGVLNALRVATFIGSKLKALPAKAIKRVKVCPVSPLSCCFLMPA